MKLNNNLTKGVVLFALAISTAACSKNDGPDNGRTSNDVEFFIAASQDSKNYLLATPDIAANEVLTIKGRGTETDQSYGTWLFPTPYIGIGLSYQKGDPGLGMGVALGPDGNIVKSGGTFQIASRFTTYNIFQEQVLTIVGSIQVKDDYKNLYSTFNFIDPAKNNAVRTVTKNTTNLTGNGEMATLSGVVQFGANNFLTGLAPSKIVQVKDEDGKVTGLETEDTAYPDSVWIASFDKDLNVTHIYKDDRISYAAGRHRSGFRNTIAGDDKDNTYVFSPSVDDNSTKPAGVIRILSGASEFDPGYYWNIEQAVAATGADKDLKFQDVYHVAGDYFILLYKREGKTPVTGATSSNTMAIVNVVDKTFDWVEGLPDYNYNPSYGTPIAEDGKFYIPANEANKKPAVYIIDPATKKAAKGIEVDASGIQGIGKLRQQ